MELQKKLLKRCEDNFNEETQKFSKNVPDDILDCIIFVLQKGGVNTGNLGSDDFVNDFICEFIHNTILNSKYGIILRIYFMSTFNECIGQLKEDLFC